MQRQVFVFLFLISTFIVCAQQKIIVAKDGSGQYTTVQQAIDAVPDGNRQKVTIYIKNGLYHEVVTIPTNKHFIRLEGEDEFKTVISFDNHTGTKLPNGDSVNTWTSASVFVLGNEFTATHIRFDNSTGFSAGQAVAVRVEGNRAAFFNCRFTGNQDVLFLSGINTKNYFRDCYIEGTTDFIFGSATAVFDHCLIHSKKNSHVTATSTPPDSPYGFVFLNCSLTADTSLHKVSLGRPWKPTASVTYIQCNLGEHILPEGWNNWKNPANEATARFSEYKSTGPGANPQARVAWSKQLTDEEAKHYSIDKILEGWKPAK